MSSFNNSTVASLSLVMLLLTTSDRAFGVDPLRKLPAAGQTQLIRLTNQAVDPFGLVMTAVSGRRVRFVEAQGAVEQFWTLSPAGHDLYRLQLYAGNRLWSLSIDPQSQQVIMVPSSQAIEQLWRVSPARRLQHAHRIESVAFPGMCLAGNRTAAIQLQPWGFAAEQLWFFDVAPPPPAIVIPTLTMAQHAVRPNPALPPVTAEIVNRHNSELWVLVNDLRTGSQKKLVIPVGQKKAITLQRDAGATLVESYEVVTPLGNVYQQTYTTAIPPTAMYEVFVFERFLQSIAIDRTGKSPNPIEDINFQPKGVGRFVIPPGDRFDGGSLDVYDIARRADNVGALPNPKDVSEAFKNAEAFDTPKD